MPEIHVLDSTLHYEESGTTGTTFVFLHGNPSSSRVWRRILPAVGAGRLLAPDLIGMGLSGKPGIPYLFADHARYLDAWFDALGLDRVVLIGHDWGGALAMDWAARHPERVIGLAFFESVVKAIPLEQVSPQARARTELLRTPGKGEELVLEQDLLVRQAFTGGVLTPLEGPELDAFLAPYPTPESRRPLLAWTRQFPIGGEPAELVARLEGFHPWLAKSEDVPKLLLTFEGSPTLAIGPELAAWCAEHMAALETVHVGPAGHHAAEDRPEEIAAAISAWADRNGLR